MDAEHESSSGGDNKSSINNSSVNELASHFCPEVEQGIRNILMMSASTVNMDGGIGTVASPSRQKKDRIESEIAEIRTLSGYTKIMPSPNSSAQETDIPLLSKVHKSYANMLYNKYMTSSCTIIAELQEEENDLFMSLEAFSSDSSHAPPSNESTRGLFYFMQRNYLCQYYIGCIRWSLGIFLSISTQKILFQPHQLNSVEEVNCVYSPYTKTSFSVDLTSYARLWIVNVVVCFTNICQYCYYIISSTETKGDACDIALHTSREYLQKQVDTDDYRYYIDITDPDNSC